MSSVGAVFMLIEDSAYDDIDMNEWLFLQCLACKVLPSRAQFLPCKHMAGGLTRHYGLIRDM